jgi:TonB family protein
MQGNPTNPMNYPRIPVLCAACLLLALPLGAQVGFPDYVPLKINQTVDPVYPQGIVDVGIRSGVACVAVSIDDSGKLADYLVTAYSHPRFAENAVAALRKWTFEPAKVHGSPRNCEADLTFRFEVEGVVLVSLTPFSINELVRYRIAPDSSAFGAASARQLDRVPTPTKIVNPVYPMELARDSRGGRVSVDFYIDEEGHVRMPSVSLETNEANENLAAIAVTTIGLWEFAPPTSKGRPVVMLARQDFEFRPAKL